MQAAVADMTKEASRARSSTSSPWPRTAASRTSRPTGRQGRPRRPDPQRRLRTPLGQDQDQRPQHRLDPDRGRGPDPATVPRRGRPLAGRRGREASAGQARPGRRDRRLRRVPALRPERRRHRLGHRLGPGCHRPVRLSSVAPEPMSPPKSQESSFAKFTTGRFPTTTPRLTSRCRGGRQRSNRAQVTRGGEQQQRDEQHRGPGTSPRGYQAPGPRRGFGVVVHQHRPDHGQHRRTNTSRTNTTGQHVAAGGQPPTDRRSK